MIAALEKTASPAKTPTGKTTGKNARRGSLVGVAVP
jgi:hypothetical protein